MGVTFIELSDKVTSMFPSLNKLIESYDITIIKILNRAYSIKVSWLVDLTEEQNADVKALQEYLNSTL